MSGITTPESVPQSVAETLLDYLYDLGTAKCREVRTGRLAPLDPGPWSPGVLARLAAENFVLEDSELRKA